MNELVRWDPFKTARPFEGSLFDVVPTLLRPIVRQVWVRPKMREPGEAPHHPLT